MLRKLLGFDKAKHNIKTEVLAGITSFLTMSYILAVNPGLFGQLDGMPAGAIFTATAVAAIIGSSLVAILAKMPFGMAPGMGANVFFVYTVCIGMGYSWQFALTAVLLEGIIFILLTVTNIREAIANAIPNSLKLAISAGIGLFIAFVGLQNAGIIVRNESTLVQLGNITSGSGLLTMIGLVITGFLVIKNIKGGMLLGILITTIIGIPMGITHYQGIVSVPHSVEPIFAQMEWDSIFSVDMLVIVITFLFIDLFNSTGTVVAVCLKGGYIDKDGKIPGLKKIFLCDSIATTCSGVLGSSGVTTYIESASGVAQGGRTGLTALTIAGCFAAALFFSPVFLAIPAAATAPVLVIVGLFMMSSIKDLNFDDMSEAIPAFITMILMPLTYSIADGILLGMISYTLINMACLKFKKISPMLYVLTVVFILKYIFL